MSRHSRAFSIQMIALQFAALWSKRISCLVGIFAFALFCAAASFSGHLSAPDGWIFTGWLALLLTSYAQMALIAADRERCAFFQAQNKLTQWCTSQAIVSLCSSFALAGLWNAIGAIRFPEIRFLPQTGIMMLFAIAFAIATFMMIQPRILRFSSQRKLALLFVTSAPWNLTAYFFGILATHDLLTGFSPRLPIIAQILLVAVLFCLCATFFNAQNNSNAPEQQQDELESALKRDISNK